MNSHRRVTLCHANLWKNEQDVPAKTRRITIGNTQDSRGMVDADGEALRDKCEGEHPCRNACAPDEGIRSPAGFHRRHRQGGRNLRDTLVDNVNDLCDILARIRRPATEA